MGPYKPLRDWVDKFIPYGNVMGVCSSNLLAHIKNSPFLSHHPSTKKNTTWWRRPAEVWHLTWANVSLGEGRDAAGQVEMALLGGWAQDGRTWMSQEVSKWLVNGL